ncbi:replication endonuclease [Vibrio cholerae]|uniref:replication endonuclease n=2 Tax=Vibrio cholerae TaxID=666 RepID=UPI003C7E0F45
MAYQNVIDLATGNREVIDFLPASTWISAKDAHWKNWTGRRHNHATLSDLGADTSYRPEIVAFNRKLSVVSNSLDNLIPSQDRTESHSVAKAPALCVQVSRILGRHYDFARHMQRAFTDCLSTRSAVDSLHAIEAAHARLTCNGYSYALPDDDLCAMAKDKAHFHTLELAKYDSDTEGKFAKVCSLLSGLGLSFPAALIKAKRENNELHSLIARACDETWLRRQLRKKCAIEVERIARDLELVQRSKQAYCSDFSVHRQRQQKRRNRAMLESMVVFNKEEPDQYFELAELHDHSIANPEIRRGEMFVRLRGFESIAIEQGHSALFVTSTAPSRFHAVSKGKVNQAWLDAGKPDAKAAHTHLMGVWKAFRKTIDKAQIKVYGMRIVEPHQDGTPHHHMLLFCMPEHTSFVVEAFRHHSLADSPNEKGAQKYRFKVEHIDFSRGSAVGYVAKYLSKNIDGKHIDTDKGTSLSGIEAAERVTAFARVNGIRQFQFIGGAPVTVWRQFRKLRNEFKEDDALFTDLNETEHFLLESIRKSADEGDWKAFTYAMGGVFVKRGNEEVKVAYDAPTTLQKLLESGELSTTRYGDLAHARVMGLMFKKVFLATRFADFEIENKAKYLSAQKRIMSGVSDLFDVLEREKEYERMNEEAYQRYLLQVQIDEELNAMVLLGCTEEEINAFFSSVSARSGAQGADCDAEPRTGSTLDLCQ